MIRWSFALIFGLAAFAVALPSLAQNIGNPQSAAQAYYGREFYVGVQRNENNDSLKRTLRTVLRADHIAQRGQYDQLVQHCDGGACYRHVVLGYDNARKFILGQYYLVQNGSSYGIREVYCDRVYPASEFRKRKPGPGIIPDDRVLNTEHTWPQSKFTNRFPDEMQKSDLHHLYPTDSVMNSIRSSFQFGNVANATSPRTVSCENARLGSSPGRRGVVFEPPDKHKGNVARALFYFALRYEMQISPEEEAALRMWAKQDPVDEEEMNRNNAIFAVQHNRNPFIDYPWLADRIGDF